MVAAGRAGLFASFRGPVIEVHPAACSVKEPPPGLSAVLPAVPSTIGPAKLEALANEEASAKLDGFSPKIRSGFVAPRSKIHKGYSPSLRLAIQPYPRKQRPT